MALRRGKGLYVLAAVVLLTAAYFTASRLGYLDVLEERYLPARPIGRLTAGDFPAGVAAPVGDIASVPLRPTLIGFTPRGSSAALLWATGRPRSPRDPAKDADGGLFRTSYALDARSVVYAREEDLRKALADGYENGGVDLAAVSVDRLAHWAHAWREASPRAVLLLGRSRGQEALAALGVQTLPELKGKRVAVYAQSSSYYFGLWLLARAGLTVTDVRWAPLTSALAAGRALREGRADAVLGLAGDVELAARDRGGAVLATTADAPHLVATVLVARGEFAARYPDAVRRVLRGLLDSAAYVLREPTEPARRLGEVAPYLGDPLEAVRVAPPATLADNLAFFGLSGQAPVTYDELYASAGDLFSRLTGAPKPPPASETRDLNALKYVAEPQRPDRAPLSP